MNISSYAITTSSRFYGIISQILLLHKTWRNCDKFDSKKSLRIYHWSVKIVQCVYAEPGSKDDKWYVQKHIAPQGTCHNPSLVREKPLGAPACCESRLLKLPRWLRQRVPGPKGNHSNHLPFCIQESTGFSIMHQHIMPCLHDNT